MKKLIKNFVYKWEFILVSVCILVIFTGFLFYFNWVWEQQGQDAAISQISIFFAAIVAIVALWSLKFTRDSLLLTRATQRPFLNVVRSVSCHMYKASIGKIIADISNSGNFPADDISVKCELRRIRETKVVTFPMPVEDDRPYPPIYFPGDNMEYHFESKVQIQAKVGDLFEIYIILNYTNKLTKEKYKTIRAYTETFTPRDNTVVLLTYPKGDEWN